MFQDPKMIEAEHMEEERRRARENTIQNLAGYIIVIGVINLISHFMAGSRPFSN